MKPHNIFITGGSGYVGRYLADALVRAGHRVAVLDRVAPPPGLLKVVEYIRGDIRNQRAVDRALATIRPDCIIHLAAITSARSVRVDALWGTNVEGSNTLLRSAVNAGCVKMVFASSAAVYGVAEERSRETDEPNPANRYGESKWAFERTLGKQQGVTSAIVRLFNVAGEIPGLYKPTGICDKPTLLCNALRVAASRSGSLTLFGSRYRTKDGFAVRDYVHVADAVSAIMLATDRIVSGKGSITVNIGSGTGTTNLELVAEIGRQLGRPVPYRTGRSRKNETPLSVADTALARSELAWSPKQSDLRSIVRSTLEHYGIE